MSSQINERRDEIIASDPKAATFVADFVEDLLEGELGGFDDNYTKFLTEWVSETRKVHGPRAERPTEDDDE